MENQSQIKITVATVTWNAAAVLQRTLDSVAEQDYPCVQHVVVDGCSSDQTLTLLRQYQERESIELEERHEIKVLSESDKGLYDAMNKAINMADGDYILFLNAGDKLHERDTLSKIADKISNFKFQTSKKTLPTASPSSSASSPRTPRNRDCARPSTWDTPPVMPSSRWHSSANPSSTAMP